MSVALVNRFIPPDRAPTAAAVARLAALLALRAPGLDLRLLGTGRVYAGGGAAGESRLWRRGLAALTDGRRLAQAAATVDAVLSLTDPPFLARHLAQHLRPGQRWAEWMMDLYPLAIWAALGQAPRRAPGRLSCFPERRRPDLRLYLGPEQAAWVSAREKQPIPHLILPTGVRDPNPAQPAPPGPGEPIRLVYAGNQGRAHWPDAMPLLAAAADPARFHLTVAVHGVGAAQLRERLASFPHVAWRDHPLAETTLDAAHVHIASLQEHWTHVCTPSRAVSALCRGRPLLFFGAAASDAWGWADGGGWRLDPDSVTAAQDLPGVLAEIADPVGLAAATRRAQRAGDRLRAVESAAVDALAAWLGERSSGSVDVQNMTAEHSAEFIRRLGSLNV